MHLLCIYKRIKNFYLKNFTSDVKYDERKFKRRMGRKINWENPLLFNDKLQWLKRHWRDPKAVICADKYAVRKYVAQKIGEEYLIEMYDVFTSVDDIDIFKLPKSFTMKGTHGSGYNIICKDKSQINWGKEFVLMKTWLKINYFWSSREWVYKDIPPRIICEKLLKDDKTNDVRDFKIFCFNGEPKLIEVDFDRFVDHKRNIFDIEWNLLDVKMKYPTDHSVKIEKPKKLKKMLELSRKLSEDFPHVRADFYYVDNKIYFGELTFFPDAGAGKVIPIEFEKTMGDWLELPKEKHTN